MAGVGSPVHAAGAMAQITSSPSGQAVRRTEIELEARVLRADAVYAIEAEVLIMPRGLGMTSNPLESRGR